jgi:NAD(P)-dependent dehydrogenase (short-subunit alcohol dehydrogenase family)
VFAIVAYRDEEAICKAAERLRAAGHNSVGVTCNVTDAARVEAMIERPSAPMGGSTQLSTISA